MHLPKRRAVAWLRQLLPRCLLRSWPKAGGPGAQAGRDGEEVAESGAKDKGK